MAKLLRSKTTTYDSAAASTTCVLASHVSGNFLLAVYEMQHGDNSFTTPSGWEPVVSAGGGNVSSAAFYKIAASNSETNPVSTHTSEQWRAATCYVFKDVPAISPVDTTACSAGYNTSANTRASRSATTTVDDVLLLHTLTEPQWRQHRPDPGPMVIQSRFYDGATGVFSGASAWTFQESFGSVPTFNWRKARGSTEDVTMVIAIKSDAGIIPARGGAPCSTPVYVGADGGYYGYTINNITATVTAIAGMTTINNPSGSSTDVGASYSPFNFVQRFQGSGATTGFQSLAEYAFDASPVSVNDKKFCLSWSIGSGLYAQRIAPLEDYGIVLGLRSGTNEYIFYRAGGSDAAPKETTAIVLDSAVAGIGHTGGGTFDPLDVQAVCASVGNASNTTYANLDTFHILDSIEIIGGDTDDPEGWGAAFEIAKSAGIPTVEKLGDSYRTKHDITVGDGSSFLHFDTNGTTLFLARPASVELKDVEMQAAGTAVVLRAQASNQTVKFNDPVVSAGNPGDTFSIHASSTSSGNWEFGGSISGFVTDYAVTLVDLGVGAYAGLTIDGCGEISADGVDLTGGVTISNSVGAQAKTITAATEEDLQTALDELAGMATSGSNGFGLNISLTDDVGNISLNAPAGMTIDKTNFHCTAARSLVIVIGSSGSDFGTLTYSGSATGFSVSNNKSHTINLSYPSGISAAEVTINRTGTQTTEFHEENAGATAVYTFTAPLGFNVDIFINAPGCDPQQFLNRDLGSTDTSRDVVLRAAEWYES